MDRVAVFVDAGYLFAAGSVLLTGDSVPKPRGQIRFQPKEAIEFLSNLAVKITGVPLLRIYWYDGTSTGPTDQQTSLAYCEGVKVRLGIVNTFGEQKGVDSLLVTDLINLSRNRSISDAVVLAGDEDLRVGVQQAQEFGVRAHLLGVSPARNNQSNLLIQESDTISELFANDLGLFMNISKRVISSLPVPEIEESSSTEEKIAAVVKIVVEGLEDDERADLVESIAASGGSIPSDLDAILLRTLGALLKRKPRGTEPSETRREFRNAILSDDR